eukprot:symbB.v1.2.004571.t1/scaffold253.1/size252469/4
MYVSWELSIDGNSIYEVLESASDGDKLTSVECCTVPRKHCWNRRHQNRCCRSSPELEPMQSDLASCKNDVFLRRKYAYVKHQSLGLPEDCVSMVPCRPVESGWIALEGYAPECKGGASASVLNLEIRNGLCATWPPVKNDAFYDVAGFENAQKRYRFGTARRDHCAVPAWRYLREETLRLYSLIQDRGGSNLGRDPTRILINLGAGDGAVDDPLGRILKAFGGDSTRPWKGVYFEAIPENCEKIREVLEATASAIQLRCGYSSPDEVVLALCEALRDQELPGTEAICQAAGVPMQSNEEADEEERLEVDAMSVDIDSYDCAALREALRIVSPKMLSVEIWPFPPPVAILTDFHPHHRVTAPRNVSGYQAISGGTHPREDGAFVPGCSLSAAIALLWPHGLGLYRLSARDALFVRGDVAQEIDLAGGVPWVPADEFQCWRNLCADLSVQENFMKLVSEGVYEHLMPFVHQHLRDVELKGSMITDSSLASGAQTTEVHEVQPGETLAFSVLKGETTMTSNIQWEFAEQDGTVIGSAEYMTSDSLKFPLLETFVVAGPAKCIQTIVSEFKPYSSEADFITNTHKYLFADEDYIYFVSDTMTLFRVDKATLSQVTSLTLTSSSYVMGFVFDSYGYLIPSSGSPSRFPIASFDSISDVSLTNTPGWSTAVLYDNGVTNYAILIPRAGVMTILNLDSWTFEREFDDSNYYYYSDGFVADDGNCYMVPYQDSMASASGLLARFNLARAVTGSRTIESVDLTGLSDANAYNWNGFTAGLQDLTYGYLIKDGLVVRFRMANLNDITEISLSSSASPVARTLKVGDHFHFLMADSDVWETWSLLNGRSSTVNLAGSGSWISLDAVFAGDYIYVYGDETGVRKMRTICQAWRSRTEAIRSCDAEVTTYGASSDLTTLMAGASFSDDVHLYYMSSGTELTRILLETENDVLNVATLTYPNSGSGYQFNGGFHDGVYGYLVPGAATMVFRFDLETFSGGTFLDLADIGATGNCKDGFALNGYGYLLPQNGIVFRLNLSSFVSSAVEQLDLTLTDTNFVKFSGGINDGTYGYLAPYQTGSGTSFGNLVQFRLDPLEYVSQIDLSTVYSGLGQFEGIFSDGTYGYLYGGSHYRIVRFTLGTLSTANVMLLSNRNGQHTMTGSLMSNTSAVLSYLYNSGLERLNLNDYTLASSDLTVDQFVSSWLDSQPTDTYELYMRSTSNYSQFYKICEVTASSSLVLQVAQKKDGFVLKRTVTDTSGFYGSFNVLFADGMSAYLLSSSTSYFFKVELSTMGSQYINQYQGTMSGGFAEGDYLYALPESSISNVLRTINASFSYPATSELTHSLSNVAGGFSDGTYGYLVPSSGGQLGRFNLQTFAMDPSTPTDLTSVHSDLSSFSGGFHDGTYGYLVPDKDGVLSASGRVVRFNLASFSGFEVLDVSNNGAFSARQQFIDGFTDFSYGFLIAGGFGRTKAIVRFSLSDFTLASVEEATVSLISSGSFVRGLRRVRYGYIFNDDGAVIKFHLKTLEQERLEAVASNVWAAFLDASGTFWMASTANSYKDFYSLCQDSLPFVNVHITCNSTAEKLTVTDESIDWVSMTFNSMMTDGIYAYLVPSTGDTALRLPLSDYGSSAVWRHRCCFLLVCQMGP